MQGRVEIKGKNRSIGSWHALIVYINGPFVDTLAFEVLPAAGALAGRPYQGNALKWAGAHARDIQILESVPSGCDT